MKNLFKKSLLVLIGLLITSFTTQVWAGPTVNGGTFYFDDSGYNWNDVYLCVGKGSSGSGSYTSVYTMKHITNTKLWYYDMSSWSGATYIRYIACNWGSGDWGTDNYNCGYGYTNIYGATYTFNSSSLYLFTTASSNNGADVYVAYQSAYSNLNKTIQVKAKVSTNNGGSYSEVTSPATLTASSKRFSNYNTCGTSSSLSNGSITCGYTATTTLTAPSTDPTGYKFIGWYNSSGGQETTSKTLTIYPTGDATYYAYYKKLYTISAGSTVIWDLGKNDANSGSSSWSSAYLYKDVEGSGTSNDALTQCGTSYQYAKTYANAVSNIKVFLFREVNTGTWNAYKQTTNLYRDVSGVTLFTYCNTVTFQDSKNKLDWQVTTNAKKATSGSKIYFDNTNVSSWTNIYLKYGTNWSGGGFTRATSKATKVAGTSNLYYITIPNDLYYKEYFLANATGSTGYNDVETMTGISARTAYQPYNFAADSTLIATTGSGAGTSGNPKVWSVTKMAGHTHSVTITAPSHGTITVAYTNESGTAQSPTSGSFNVARTCSLTVSSSAATGYKPSTLKINGNAHISGNVYILRENITVAATFTPKSCSVVFDKEGGDDGDDGTTATYDADLETIDIPSKDGYTFGGYWDGDDGTGTQYYNADGTSARTWDKNTESETTLYAKWDEITHKVSFANDGNGSTDPDEDQTVGVVTGVDISATPSTGYEFNTWTSSNGGTFNSAATTASNTFKPTAGDATLTASFRAKTYSITLSASSDQVGGGESVTDGSASVTYMGTSLTSIVPPERPGYEVEYYTLSSNGNNTVADNEGALAHGLLGYLTNDGEWIYDDDLTIYAHWVPKTYIINLDANRSGIPGTNGSTRFSVTIGSNNFDFDLSTAGRQSMTAPTKEGYTFAGYYDDPDEGEGVKVINADASKPTTSYVNSDGNWINSDDDLTLYAHWTDNHIYYYNGATADGWSTASNWTKGAVPASDGSNTIHILKPLVISSDKKVAAVDIITSGTYTPTGGSAIDASGKLTINPNVGLNVTGTVTRTADATSNLATREGDLVLESSSAGNASLIFDNSYSCQATVQMYSKASISGNTWNWQYVGTPFTGSIPLYNYYGSWMYKWNGGWDVVHGGDELTPFAGYCLTQESATTHVMGGILVPTTTSGSISVSSDMVLANSWTAPIYIGGFTEETFTSEPATIYLFNTGSAENGSSAGSESGTYVAIPIFTTPYVGGGLIAPMQGFFVTTNGGSAGTITMNYADLVRPADSRSIVAGPMYAPKRAEEGDEPVLQDQPEEAPTVLKIWANGSVYNDRLVILAREDFSEGFDNGWDGEKMSFGVASPSVYVINAQGGYDAVSAIPNLEGTVIGFRAGTDNQYTMTFSYEGEDEWYLNDLKAETSTLITSAQTYSFSAAQADSEARFVISKTPINKVPTGFDAINDGSYAHKQLINGTLYIIRDGRIYDAQGALVK